MLKNWICWCLVSSVALAEVIEYHAHPQYRFEYGVNDPGTQDVKSQWESRDGDTVQGSYSFKEADGTVRIVEYHANDRTGFNAVVRREGHAAHPETRNRAPAPVQTFEHTAIYTPVETIEHTPTSAHTTVQNPGHTLLGSSVNTHNSVEVASHSSGPYEASIQVHTGLPTSMRSPVHIPTETVIHTSVQTPVRLAPSSVRTAVYETEQNSEKSVIHAPILTSLETIVRAPEKHLSVQPEVLTHHGAPTITKSVEHRNEPEAYNSQIAGAQSA